MVQIGQGTPLGTSIDPSEMDVGSASEVLRTNAGATAVEWSKLGFANLGTDLFKGKLLASQTVTNNETISGLDAYDYYVVIMKNITSDSGVNSYNLQFNSDAGGNYSGLETTGTTWATYSGRALMSGIPVGATGNGTGIFFIDGITKATASGLAHISMACSGGEVGTRPMGLSASWAGGNATQISSITFARWGGTSNMSADVEIYGVDN